MDHSDIELRKLLAVAKNQGFLTYDQVNEYLPNEAVTPEKLDNLLVSLEELGIELVTEDPTAGDKPKIIEDEPLRALPRLLASGHPKLSDDPIRMYSEPDGRAFRSSRATRKSRWPKQSKSRASVFAARCCRATLRCSNTVETLEKVHEGKLPFDRTIKVSLTERLTKEQILARMPHNLQTLKLILAANRGDFRKLLCRSTPRPIGTKRAAAFSAAAARC